MSNFVFAIDTDGEPFTRVYLKEIGTVL